MEIKRKENIPDTIEESRKTEFVIFKDFHKKMLNDIFNILVLLNDSEKSSNGGGSL